jgi:hypothetical protein
MTFGLLGSTLTWHSLGSQRVGEDLGTPRVVVDQVAVPTVRTDVPVEPAPGTSSITRSAEGQGGAEAEADGSVPEPSAQAPVVIAELTPRKVDPFALVGVTWASGVPLTAKVSVRWRGEQGWSDWTSLDQENSTPEEGRPGTEPQWVKWANAVAVRVTSPVRAVPKDLRIATVDPGDVRGITPAAVGQPGIILRSAWHARAQNGCSRPIYGSSTQAAVIHHTVGSNSYSKAESPGIVRSIQAYHMQANHWCDIGYNFLVDRYGQIFEGRGGGIARPVRAAHSGNAKVNELTMGVSLMGTFTNTAPTSAMKAAAARLVAWRFSIGHIPAKGKVSIGGRTLERIAGHRNVVSTACPGQYAYVWLGASGGLRDTVAKILGSTGAPPGLTGFRAAARGTSIIDYQWNPVKRAAKYQIRLSRSPDFTHASSRIVVASGTRVKGLVPGATYYAMVRGLGPSGGGYTKWTGRLAKTTWPPPGQAGIPQGLRWTSRTTSSVALAWKGVRGAAKYQVRLSRYPTMARPSAPVVTTTGAQFGRLSSGTTYYAQVRALGRDGRQLGGWSKRITVATAGTAAKPAAFTPTRELAGPTSGSLPLDAAFTVMA